MGKLESNKKKKEDAALKEKFQNVEHVKDVLWYDSVADLSIPVSMIPEKFKEGFFNGDATMMIALFDNTTSSDAAMEAVSDMRKIANEQCFISGMSGVVTDIKNLALEEMPIYVVIAACLSLLVLLLAMDSLDGSVDESPDCVTVYQHFHNLYGTFYRSSGTASAPQVKR